MARNPNSDPRIPQPNFDGPYPNGPGLAHSPLIGLSDQEIRARALECASRICSNPNLDSGDELLWRMVQDFEDYIRNGNVR